MCDKFQLDVEVTVLGDGVKCCGSPAEGDSQCLEAPEKVALEWEIKG